MKIFLLSIITLPFILKTTIEDSDQRITLNVLICIGYIGFGNIIDSIQHKKTLTLAVEFMLVVGFALLALSRHYLCCDFFDDNQFRLMLVVGFLAGHVEIMTIYTVVSWFSKKNTVLVLSLLNTAFIVMCL